MSIYYAFRSSWKTALFAVTKTVEDSPRTKFYIALLRFHLDVLAGKIFAVRETIRKGDCSFMDGVSRPLCVSTARWRWQECPAPPKKDNAHIYISVSIYVGVVLCKLHSYCTLCNILCKNFMEKKNEK